MILNIAIGSYGGLSLLAALLQGYYKNISRGSAVILGIGGILMLSTLFIGDMISVYVLTSGVMLAHVSAVMNGIKMYGKLNKSHHFARLIISILLVVSQVMSVRGL